MRKPLFTLALGMMAVAAMLAVVLGDTSESTDASSHRDAPLITEDPTADNTDVYAFVSTEPGRGDYVTLISNFIPLEEPGEGPNYYRFSDNVLYEIKVDTDGDAEEDLTYQFDFTTKIGAVTPETFLYNTGKIGLPPNPGDPASQYTNWNQPTRYKLTQIGGGDGDDDDDDDDAKRVLLKNARVAPIHIGPNSTGTVAEYEALAAAAVHTAGDTRVFAGPRDEGFYVDLEGNFDLLNFRNPGVDTTSGFNVHTIALEIPKSALSAAGDEDGNIGVWSTASRARSTVLGKEGAATKRSGKQIQVSRLGNPLVNEVLLPLSIKDRYNATKPEDDGEFIAPYITDPGNDSSRQSNVRAGAQRLRGQLRSDDGTGRPRPGAAAGHPSRNAGAAGHAGHAERRWPRAGGRSAPEHERRTHDGHGLVQPSRRVRRRRRRVPERPASGR